MILDHKIQVYNPELKAEIQLGEIGTGVCKRMPFNKGRIYRFDAKIGKGKNDEYWEKPTLCNLIGEPCPLDSIQ